jgi:cytochrome c556
MYRVDATQIRRSRPGSRRFRRKLGRAACGDKSKTASTSARALNAKPAIWDHWNEFLADTNKLREETMKLAALASSGDARAISDQYRTVAKACIACHDSFRRGRADKL